MYIHIHMCIHVHIYKYTHTHTHTHTHAHTHTHTHQAQQRKLALTLEIFAENSACYGHYVQVMILLHITLTLLHNTLTFGGEFGVLWALCTGDAFTTQYADFIT